MTVDDSLFSVADIDTTRALATSSTATNIHSHYLADNTDTAQNYTATGRLRTSAPDSGIGVTVLSDYTDTDSYYRLRRYGTNGTFHLDPHGTTITGGTTDTGVAPQPDTWYRYRIETLDTGTRTEIRANVWAENTPEPTSWQINAHDTSPTRRTNGTIGVWSMGPGTKYWDDTTLTTTNDPTPPRTFTLTTDTVGDGTIRSTPTRDTYQVGDTVTLTATPAPGWTFTGWTGDAQRRPEPAHAPTARRHRPHRGVLRARRHVDHQRLRGGGAGIVRPWVGRHRLEQLDEPSTTHCSVSPTSTPPGHSPRPRPRRTSTPTTSPTTPTAPRTTPPPDDSAPAPRAAASASPSCPTTPTPTPTTGSDATEPTAPSTSTPTAPPSPAAPPTTGVAPQPDTWYRYRIETLDTGTRTEIRANVWAENTPEPTSWQINAHDTSPTRRTNGTIGVWSMGPGTKYWDDTTLTTTDEPPADEFLHPHHRHRRRRHHPERDPDTPTATRSATPSP